MKASLEDTALKSKFSDAEKDIKNEIKVIVEKEFLSQWSDHADAVSALPDKFFSKVEYVFLTVQGKRCGIIDITPTRSPECYSTNLVVNCRKLEKLIIKKENLVQENLKVKREIRCFLRPISSSRQLYAEWPEARSIIDFETEPTVKKKLLPSVTVQSLNKSLGLP